MAEFSTETIDVLHILINAVLADDFIRPEQLQMLSKRTGELNLTDINGAPISQAVIQNWLVENYSSVVETYAGIGKDVQQIHLFIRLNDYKNKSRLIEIIIEICNADGAYHQNEKVLVELVKAYWT